MKSDPVCGMKVDEKSANFKSEHKGETHYFCNKMCKETFDKNPKMFENKNKDQTRHGSCCC
jgi:YHS domain-containing protein